MSISAIANILLNMKQPVCLRYVSEAVQRSVKVCWLRPLPSPATRPQIPSPSADHANTFIFRPFSFRLVQPAHRFRFRWCPIDSTLTYVDRTERVMLLCGKQVTFRLSSRFFDYSLGLRHRCLLVRNFLERKIINRIFLEHSYMINA